MRLAIRDGNRNQLPSYTCRCGSRIRIRESCYIASRQLRKARARAQRRPGQRRWVGSCVTAHAAAQRSDCPCRQSRPRCRDESRSESWCNYSGGSTYRWACCWTQLHRSGLKRNAHVEGQPGGGHCSTKRGGSHHPEEDVGCRAVRHESSNPSR